MEALIFLKGGRDVICLLLVAVQENYFFSQANSFLVITQY